MNKLSASLEDYLELICNKIEAGENIKAVEISKILNVSRASVSEALMKLAEKKLITYEGHKYISITQVGRKRAKEIISKHNIFTCFFQETLGIDKKTAEENACKIEHVISSDIYARIKDFQNYCSNNEKFIKDFKEQYIRN